jgi:hypothetical protein
MSSVLRYTHPQIDIGESVQVIGGNEDYKNFAAAEGKFLKTGELYLSSEYPELYERSGYNIDDIWTPVDSQTTSAINDIAYGNGLYVAIGDIGSIRTSSDLLTWNTAATGTTVRMEKIIFVNGIFVVGSQLGQIRTSTDGITWTTRTSSNLSVFIKALTYTNNLYIYGTNGWSQNQPRIGTSTDGITWNTAVSTGLKEGTDNIIGIAYGNGLYVAAAETGLTRTSTDTINWEVGSVLPTSQLIRALTFANNQFVYAGTGGVLGTSTDGITWTTRTSGTTSTINGLTFGNNLFVTAGNGGVIRTSTDGITWDARTSGTTSIINALTFGNGLFMYAGSGGALGVSRVDTQLEYLPISNKNNLLAADTNLYNTYPQSTFYVRAK